jgi:hypothetical protein
MSYIVRIPIAFGDPGKLKYHTDVEFKDKEEAIKYYQKALEDFKAAGSSMVYFLESE